MNGGKPESKKIEQTTEAIRLSGILVEGLLNENFIKKLKAKDINATPFLIGIDINKETILTVSHHAYGEIGEKVLHVESRMKSDKDKIYVKTLSDIIKEMGD